MTDLDSTDVLSRLMGRQVLFEILRRQFEKEPKDEDGIKLCDEQIEILEKKINDIIINGTGDKDKEPVGILNLRDG